MTAARRFHFPALALLCLSSGGLGATEDQEAKFVGNRGNYWALDRVVTALGYGDAPISKDWDALVQWVEYGASVGHAMSEQVLGSMSLQGLAGVKTDRTRAIELLRRSARHGYDTGQHDLATLLLQTAKTGAEKEEAIGWMQEAARQGHRFAREKLAAMGLPYRAGADGVKPM